MAKQKIYNLGIESSSIAERQWEESTIPLVSISCITYNHINFIAKAIDSFLMQETTFPVEILIHDDASTDGTAEIIREYEKTYPDLILPIYQTENQFSKGIKISFTYQFPRARGKYIALCEGDDYWTDPSKLQKQIDFLERNPEYVMCAHNTLRIFEDKTQEPHLAILHPKDDLELIDFIDLDYLQKRNNLVLPAHTSSYVIRASAMPKVYPEWAMNCISGDLSITTLVASQGKTRFLNEMMSVRRKHVGSITKRSGASLMAAYMNFVVTMKAIDAYFDYKFTKIQDKNIYDLLTKVVEWHLSENDLISAIKAVLEGYTIRSKIQLLFLFNKLLVKNTIRFVLFQITGFARLMFKPLRWLKGYIKKTNRKKEDLRPPQITLSCEKQHTFFGYYDINPFNSTDTQVLAVKVDSELSSPIPGRIAEVGYFDIKNSKPVFVKTGQTETWNWQQGCRLQWYPAGDDRTVFYNCMIDDHYGSLVQDLDSKEILHRLDYPIYHLNKTGKLGLSLNFSRLHRLRPGYGYAILPDKTANDPCPKDDGVWVVDIQKNQATLLFSLADLAEVSPQESMENAQHYINHLCFNPSGSSFLFLHLWVDVHGRRNSRVFVSSTHDSELTLPSNQKIASHYCWLSDTKYLVYMLVDNQLNGRFALFDIFNSFDGIVGINHLIADGHQTFFSHGTNLLLDTSLPDEYGEKKLIVFDVERNIYKVIDRFYFPPAYSGELRCDLHPRISSFEKRICIDAVENNMRVMKIVDITKIYS